MFLKICIYITKAKETNIHVYTASYLVLNNPACLQFSMLPSLLPCIICKKL